MPKANDYVCILWGDHFEEATAAIFVTELRQAGVRVKVVGLDARRLSGANGLALLPDLTLGKALTLEAKPVGVVIPCAASDLLQLKNDPRLGQFLAQAQTNQAKFVIRQASESDLAALNLFPPDQVIAYPEDEGLLEFVRELAGSLVTQPNGSF